MKRLRQYLTVAAVLTFLLLPGVAHADVNNFTVTNFAGRYDLIKDDPQGSLAVLEQIDVNFTDYNHGIERALPQKYNGQNVRLEIAYIQRDGLSEKYSTRTSNGNLVLKIGDANKTITGAHHYEIKYTVQNVIRFTAGHDELLWNTNGTGWGQPFERVSAELNVPDPLAATLTGATCYTGQQGSTASDCQMNTTGSTTTFTTTRVLRAGENMTFAGDFPVGTFAKPTALDWWKDHLGTVLQVVVPPLLALAYAYPRWRKNGKDLKGRGTIVPEYAPPAGLRAAEADCIYTYKVGPKAASATIIDLAIRKYIRITESESNGVLGLGKHKVYSFTKLAVPLNDNLKPYEQAVLEGLFPDNAETTQLSDLKNKFYKTIQEIQNTIPDRLTKDGYFAADPKGIGQVMTILATAAIFVGGFIFGVDWALAIGVALGAAIVFLFAKLMPKRTQQGVDAKDALEGLKLYMNTAEKDRIAMLQSANAPYASKTDAPQQTVELFEKLLPFAMILGVEKTWAKQFESIYTTPPDWYAGNWTAFNAGYLVTSLNGSMSAMNTSFAAPGSAGSGAGGGFSGGGGGGGGGGGW